MSSTIIATFVFILIAAGFGLMMLGINYFLPILLGEQVKKKGKLDPYECGVGQLSDTRGRFSVKFYVVALMFVLFDIETVFLIPPVVAYRELLQVSGNAQLVMAEAFVFVGVLVVGLIYIWKRGVLEW